MPRTGFLTALAVIALPAFAVAQDVKLPNCADLDAFAEEDYPIAFTCVGLLREEVLRVDRELQKARNRLKTLEDTLDARIDNAIAAANSLPGATVAAFDDSNGCPAGWEEFPEAQGRVIIGASFGMESGLFREEHETTPRKYRDHGGQEEVALKGEEAPPHNHGSDANLGLAVRDGRYTVLTGQYDNTDKELNLVELKEIPTHGEGEHHDNMPPYIALYFCKKD